VRGLLVTPWFAAGAGFVIAAALALNSPHTVLTYRPSTTKCHTCTRPGSLATAKPGVQLKPVKPAHPDPKTGTATHSPAGSAGPEVGYRVVEQGNGAFAAIITVPAAQARHGWSLRLEFPGRRILQVSGAQWQPAADGDSGMASEQASWPGRHGWPGHSRSPVHPGSGPSGGPGQSAPSGQLRRSGQRARSGSHGHPGQRIQHGRRFLVTVQGNPVAPAGCVLNRTSCHFG
jgi:hypothetical protein